MELLTYPVWLNVLLRIDFVRPVGEIYIGDLARRELYWLCHLLHLELQKECRRTVTSSCPHRLTNRIQILSTLGGTLET